MYFPVLGRGNAVDRFERGGEITVGIETDRLRDVGNTVICGFQQFTRLVDADFIEKLLEGERRGVVKYFRKIEGGKAGNIGGVFQRDLFGEILQNKINGGLNTGIHAAEFDIGGIVVPENIDQQFGNDIFHIACGIAVVLPEFFLQL